MIEKGVPIKQGKKTRKGKAIEAAFFAMLLTGACVLVFAFISILYFSFHLSGITLLITSQIIVIPFLVILWLLPRQSLIKPIILWENGIEVPARDSRERMRGERDFLNWTDIREIQKGGLLKDNLLVLTTGKKYVFLTRSRFDTVTIEDVIRQWESKRLKKEP